MTLSLKVLVMDDEQLLLHALNRACRGRLLDITTATSVEEVLEKIEGCRYDLFLFGLELELPRHLELLKEIDERCPYVPIVIMTIADTDLSGLHDVIRSVRKHGVWHLLEKPFRLESLFGFLDAMIRDKERVNLPEEFLVHDYEQEKRCVARRNHIRSVNFSYNTIAEGAARRITTTGILTDISECGSCILSSEPLRPGLVVSFGDDPLRKTGIVAWSVMVEKGTCRSGVRFCS